MEVSILLTSVSVRYWQGMYENRLQEFFDVVKQNVALKFSAQVTIIENTQERFWGGMLVKIDGSAPENGVYAPEFRMVEDIFSDAHYFFCYGERRSLEYAPENTVFFQKPTTKEKR